MFNLLLLRMMKSDDLRSFRGSYLMKFFRQEFLKKVSAASSAFKSVFLFRITLTLDFAPFSYFFNGLYESYPNLEVDR